MLTKLLKTTSSHQHAMHQRFFFKRNFLLVFFYWRFFFLLFFKSLIWLAFFWDHKFTDVFYQSPVTENFTDVFNTAIIHIYMYILKNRWRFFTGVFSRNLKYTGVFTPVKTSQGVLKKPLQCMFWMRRMVPWRIGCV